MSLILSNSTATTQRSNRDDTTDYIFYTTLDLDRNKFQLVHFVELVVGSNGTNGTYDLYLLFGGGEEYYMGTFRQYNGKTSIYKIQDMAQRFVTSIEENVDVSNRVIVRIKRKQIPGDTITTTTTTVIGTEFVEQDTTLYTLTYTHPTPLDLTSALNTTSQGHAHWKISFRYFMNSTLATRDFNLLYYTDDNENRVELNANSGNLVLNTWTNWTSGQTFTPVYTTEYTELKNGITYSYMLTYSESDGTCTNTSFNATPYGTLIQNMALASSVSPSYTRNAIIFPSTGVAYLDVSEYSTGPHIQPFATFSFWAKKNAAANNEQNDIFVIKNVNVSDNEERFQIRILSYGTGWRLTTVFRGIEADGLICSLGHNFNCDPEDWTHFAVVIASGVYEQYINGILCTNNVTNFIKPGADENIQQTFIDIALEDEIYIGTNRLITQTTLEQQPTNYNNVITDGTVVAHLPNPDGLDIVNTYHPAGAPFTTPTVYTIDGRTGYQPNGQWFDMNAHKTAIVLPKMTWSIWIHDRKPNIKDGKGSNEFVFQLRKHAPGDVNTTVDFLNLRQMSNSEKFQVRVDINDVRDDTYIQYTTNQWNLWTFVFDNTDSTGLRVYLNAVEQTMPAKPYDFSNWGPDFHLGVFGNWSGSTVTLNDGQVVDDLLFFNRALSATEVGYLFNSQPSTTTTYEASFTDQNRCALSDFQIFARKLTSTEIGQLGAYPTFDTVDPLPEQTTSFGPLSLDNRHKCVLESDGTDITVTDEDGIPFSLPDIPNFTITDAQYGGNNVTHSHDLTIDAVTLVEQDITETTTTTTTIPGTVADWRLKVKINQV